MRLTKKEIKFLKEFAKCGIHHNHPRAEKNEPLLENLDKIISKIETINEDVKELYLQQLSKAARDCE